MTSFLTLHSVPHQAAQCSGFCKRNGQCYKRRILS